MNEFKKSDSSLKREAHTNPESKYALCEACNQTFNMLMHSLNIKIQITKVKRVRKGNQTIKIEGVLKRIRTPTPFS